MGRNTEGQAQESTVQMYCRRDAELHYSRLPTAPGRVALSEYFLDPLSAFRIIPS